MLAGRCVQPITASWSPGWWRPTAGIARRAGSRATCSRAQQGLT